MGKDIDKAYQNGLFLIKNLRPAEESRGQGREGKQVQEEEFLLSKKKK